jgi:hypothetical protein
MMFYFHFLENEGEENEELNGSLILSDARGIYIPQNFCEGWQQNNISDDDWQCCLRGPYWEEEIPCTPWQKFLRMLACYVNTGLVDWNIQEFRTVYNEWYWEAWTSILDNWEATVDGIKCTLYQDGDVWMLEEKINSTANPAE